MPIVSFQDVESTHLSRDNLSREIGAVRPHRRWPEGTKTCHFRKRATSAPAEGAAYGLDFARLCESPLRALQVQNWHVYTEVARLVPPEMPAPHRGCAASEPGEDRFDFSNALDSEVGGILWK